MKEIKASQIRENVFRLIGKDWMLVTAGTEDSYNMMTASWGLMGELWGHETIEIFVRKERYTREFIDREKSFTLSFFPNEMTKALEFMGTHSGRTFNKMQYGGLHPEVLPTGRISFCGAKLVIECNVLYHDEFKPENFVEKDIYNEWYNPTQGGIHERYIAEIVRVWISDEYERL